MIFYFSGRVLRYSKPRRGMKQRPEEVLKGKGNVRLSFHYVSSETRDKERFETIVEHRRKI